MTKADVDTIMAEMPDVIDMGKAGKWHKKYVCHASWCNTWINGELQEPTMDIVDKDTLTLLPAYDRAFLCDKGYMPTKENFCSLRNDCEVIKIEDNDGLLLKYEDRYLYLEPGFYWTSSYCLVFEEGKTKIKPYSVHIKRKINLPTTDYNFSKVMLIHSVAK